MDVPELPEVETIRAGLAPHVLHRTITGVEVYHPRAVRRHEAGPHHFTQQLRGRQVQAAVRRGKYLWLLLDDSQALVVHLGMSGQLLVHHPDRPGHRHLRVQLRLDDGRRVSFVDQRTFGHLMVTGVVPTGDGHPAGQGSDLATIPIAVAHIARDPLDPHVDEEAVSQRLRLRRTEIKRALLDQRLISGIGNIYADEALWRARIHPRRLAVNLRPATVVELMGHVRDVLGEALRVGGTSFDALYVDVAGEAGYFARELRAYGRAGQPCRRCSRLLVRESFTNRSSTFCPGCQRPPRRVLQQPARQ